MDGLYLLWWVQEKQLSTAVVAASMAAGDLLLMALEVPTGWFADRFGYRRSLILGSILQVAGMICCWLADGIPGLVAASLLVAVADAFRSGADQALLYRTCIAIGRGPEFQRIEARTRAVQVVTLAVLIVGGGAIVTTWGFAAAGSLKPRCVPAAARSPAQWSSRQPVRTTMRTPRPSGAQGSRGEQRSS